MKKSIIRLTESDLHGIIRNSVSRVIREMDGDGNIPIPHEAYNTSRVNDILTRLVNGEIKQRQALKLIQQEISWNAYNNSGM